MAGRIHFPDTVGVVYSPGRKYQLEERGKLMLGGRCEPYTKTWGCWEKEADAEIALAEYKEAGRGPKPTPTESA